MLKYIVAGICAGLISIVARSFLHLNLAMVVIVTAGIAAFVAGVLPRRTQREARGQPFGA